MAHPRRWFLASAILALIPNISIAQIGVPPPGGGPGPFSCTATSGGTPELRPEGYTELVGDILITCTGGAVYPPGVVVPATNITVYMVPGVPITSRVLGPGDYTSSGFASDILLTIDEPGSGLPTPATGGYGPQAPQSLCTSAQQHIYPGNPCQAAVGVDNSGQYIVTVVPNTSTPAPNVFQGAIDNYGADSVTFYGVPVLPPATSGISRVFRITNIRVPVPGGILTNQLQALISTDPSPVLPVSGSSVTIGVVGPAMKASVNASPVGGGNPFTNCAPVTTPSLASRITFTEGFATSFKTRVVPFENTRWAAEAQNLASPSNQNIPGSQYAGYAQNNESGLILPALTYTDSTSNITYTAGLADFGTRLKAVFSFIPAGATIYVSTTSAGTVTVPGGVPSVTPYAVLVAAGQSAEATGDGASFAPLASSTIASDGLSVYPLEADNSGAAAAIWEVVNSNPEAIDTLTFSVYIAYGSTFGTINHPTNAALSFAPEPGGGSFTTVNATQGLDGPEPRFAIINNTQGGQFATINACPIYAGGDMPIDFAYSIGGSAPSPRSLQVSTSTSNLAPTVTPSVTTPSGGTWLSAALNSGVLTISVNPANLAAPPTAYTGTVQLSAGGQTLTVPVNLTVYPPAQFSVTSSHTGNFAQGQSIATYSVVVSNASSTAPTTASPTVTESPSTGLSLVSMAGTGWNCNTVPTCTRTAADWLDPGAIYPSITVTVSVASNATSPQTNTATASVPGLLDVTAYDPTVVTSQSCDVKSAGSFTIGDLQSVINEALGVTSAGNDLNADGVVNVSDIQLVLNSVMTQICVI